MKQLCTWHGRWNLPSYLILGQKKENTKRSQSTLFLDRQWKINLSEIMVLHKTNKKKFLEMLNFWTVCSSICLIYLVGTYFAWVTASVPCDMEVISLWLCWDCYRSPDYFDMSLQLVSVPASGVSHFFLLTIHHIFSVGFRSSEFAGKSSTIIWWSFNQLLVLWRCGQVPSPEGK